MTTLGDEPFGSFGPAHVPSSDGPFDVNGDGMEDLVVYPGRSFSGANARIVLFASSQEGTQCFSAAGTFMGRELELLEDTTNGFKDLRVTASASHFKQVIRTYVYEDGAYQVEDTSECCFEAAKDQVPACEMLEVCR
jgi:hypothetical protein